MKKLLLSFAAAACCMSMATADEVTLNVDNATDFVGTLTEETLKDDGTVKAAKHYQPVESFKLGGFDFSFTDGGNSNAPAYYWATSTAKDQQRTVRLYGQNTMAIAAAAGTEITQIVFDLDQNSKKTSMTVDTGTITFDAATPKVITWTGAANAITFTSEGTIRIKGLTVTTGTSTMETLAVPTFTPASGTSFADQLAVTIAAEEGTTVYYTLDGTAPTTESGKYEAPIVLTATTTVKAYAVKEGFNDSPVATATYTKDMVMESIEDIIKAGLTDEETEFTYSGKAAVTYVNGSNLYLRDETASILVYGKLDKTYTQGDVLSGFKGTFKNYYSTYELMANAATFGEPEGTETVEPYVMTIAQITPEDQNEYIIIKNVSYDGTKVTDATGSMTAYNKFNLDFPATETDKDLVALISYYQAKGADAPELQLYPLEFKEPVSVEDIQADRTVLVRGNDIIAPADAEIYSISGARVNANGLATGVYVVRTGDKAHKVMVK